MISDSACSPEDFGKRMGVSGMTVRRWLSKPKKAKIPKLYVPAIREACYQLISEGKLQVEMSSVHAILMESQSHQYGAALSNLGLPSDFFAEGRSVDRILVGLNQIGSQSKKQTQVDASREKVFSFKKMSDEWSERISTLWSVIRSKKLSSMDKLVAYGALFYLVTPIDFIPDHIPFFGLLDDFWVLGISATYYAKKFAEIP